ncbi:MAG: AMP-binding protein [Chloroflexi bacterium]|nr:AMP-binding protein [Chloroflexota bacterium]
MAKATRYTPEMIAHYKKLGYWSDETFAGAWDRNARLYPGKEALVDSRRRLTWAEANLWTDRIALGLLELGIKKDELILVQLPNCAEAVMLRIACEKAGILCLPLLHTYRHKEMAETIDRVRPVGIVIPLTFRGFDHFQMAVQLRTEKPWLKEIFVAGEDVPAEAVSLEEMARRPVEDKYPPDYLKTTRCQAHEFSLVLSTSGTTGFPKFIEYPICSTMCREKYRAMDYGLTGDDIYGCIGPAQGGPNGPIYFGAALTAAKVVLLERFEPEKALELIQKERVTFLPAVPAQLAKMLDYPGFSRYDLRSLKCIWCMGAALPYELGGEVERRMGRITQAYSSIDASTGAEHRIDQPLEERLRTVGKPYAGAEIKIADDNDVDLPRGEVGEIVVRGPGGVGGYYLDPESTWAAWSKDGWFHMGDLGRFDEKGNLVITGRKKDIIIRGGQNIYPAEIEQLLVTHPKVLEAAVVKMPDAVMGEKACAYVVPRSGENFAFDDMIMFLREKDVATYKLPERLEVIDKLPMVAAGQKVDKKALEADIRSKLR